MSASVGAAPAELDVLAVTLHELGVRQRLVVRRLEVALEAARRAHRTLAISSAGSLRSLRAIVDEHDRLAADVAGTAERLRSADRVLFALGGEGRSAPGDRSQRDPLPEVGDDAEWRWQWPRNLGVGWSWVGDRMSADAEAGVGVRTTAGVGVDIVDGALALGAHAETKLGAWMRAAALGAIGPLVVHAAAEVFVGAEAHANASVAIGRNGARADLGAGAFAGGNAEGEIGADLGPVGVTAGAEARYGIGADIDATASVTWDEVQFSFDFGVALGLGGGLSTSVTLHPRELFDGVVDLGDRTVRVTRDVWDAGTDRLGDGFDAMKDLGGDAFVSAGRTLAGLLP